MQIILSASSEKPHQAVTRQEQMLLIAGPVTKKCQTIMKRIFNYIAATVFAISLFSCVELEELNNGQDVIESGQKVKLILNANKGELKSSADTKVFVGQASNGKVVYYWNENDKIGVIPFGVSDAKPNYVTTETQINQGNKNQAQFESYLKADGYITAKPNLLIYYPYNSSMLEGTS